MRNEEFAAITRRIQAVLEEKESHLTPFCDVTVKIQDGKPVLVEILTKHKPGLGSDLAPTLWLDYPPTTRHPTDMRGRRCFGGLSAAGHGREAAFVLLFPPDDSEGQWRTLDWTWTAAHGEAVNANTVATTVMDAADTYNFPEVGFDPWDMAAVAGRLTHAGLAAAEVRQGFHSLTHPTRLVVELMQARRIVSEVPQAFGLGRLALKEDAAGNLQPDDSRSTGIASPIHALINAMARALAHEGNKPTV
ncbi:MAG TPA: terminase TerL endonuclease subunit [Symbiobacteriaceae bacterium]